MTVGSIPGTGSIPNLPGSLSYDRGNDGSCPYIRSFKMCLARSNMRVCGHWIQPPGVTQRIRSGRALPGGPSELTPTVTEVIFELLFVRAWFLPSCYECTETMRIEQLDARMRLHTQQESDDLGYGLHPAPTA